MTGKLACFVDLVPNIGYLFISYFETQNYFKSSITPSGDVISHIHAASVYSFTVKVGVTFQLFPVNEILFLASFVI